MSWSEGDEEEGVVRIRLGYDLSHDIARFKIGSMNYKGVVKLL